MKVAEDACGLMYAKEESEGSSQQSHGIRKPHLLTVQEQNFASTRFSLLLSGERNIRENCMPLLCTDGKKSRIIGYFDLEEEDMTTKNTPKLYQFLEQLFEEAV